MSQNICNICGANYEYRNGRWRCPACGAYKAEELSNEEATLFYNAAQKLRICDFDEAEKAYTDIMEKFPNNPNGYWGRLLSRYGIKYEEDFDGRKIPTCYAASIESVVNDKDYIKALSLADSDTKAYFEQQARYIERVRKEWIEKAQKEKPYDIFICYKDSDRANGIDRTKDSIAAQDLYIHLTEQGYRVFFSRESLREKVGEKYEPYIFNALSTAKVMLVYGSKPEYITSTWLKNEWTRYEKRVQAGEKKPNSLIVACDGFSPSELSKTLSSMQCFDATKRSFYSDLDVVLKKIIKGKDNTEPASAKEQKKKKAHIVIAFALVIIAVFATLYAIRGSIPTIITAFKPVTTAPVTTARPITSTVPVSSAGLEFKLNSNEKSYTLVGIGNCTEEDIVIGTYNNLPVTAIGNNAFEDCSDIQSVVIGETVMRIGDSAFYNCTSLTGIELPSSVTVIGDSAFFWCTSLTSIELPSGITSIEDKAFRFCHELASIEIPLGVTSIGDYAFDGCLFLRKIEIPSSVTSIGNHAFAGCTWLKSIEIPSSVTSIGNSVFYNCSPESIIVEEGNEYYYVEGNCLIEKKSGTILGGCDDSVIPNDGSIKHISAGAFSLCDFKSIEIPSSITSIGNYAFGGCSDLIDVYYDGTKEDWEKISIDADNEDLTTATIHYSSELPSQK